MLKTAYLDTIFMFVIFVVGVYVPNSRQLLSIHRPLHPIFLDNIFSRSTVDENVTFLVKIKPPILFPHLNYYELIIGLWFATPLSQLKQMSGLRAEQTELNLIFSDKMWDEREIYFELRSIRW